MLNIATDYINLAVQWVVRDMSLKANAITYSGLIIILAILMTTH